MPRVARALANNSFYHILTRGNNKKKIFLSRWDYSYFLKLVDKYSFKHPLYIYHYCLMPNHIHLFIKSIKAKNVPKFLQILLQSYAAYFRHRHKHVGFLFQNRYKSKHIYKENYFLECARYVERNPVRAGFVDSPEKYKWSSCSYYINKVESTIIKEPSPAYTRLAETDFERVKLYKEYLSEAKPYDDIVDRALKIT